MPTHTPDSFGQAATTAAGMTVVRALDDAPTPQPARSVPAVARLLQGNGTNIITFSFAPGQHLNDHKAAHPITVQCLSGVLDFGCGDTTVRMTPGTVLHLDPFVVHRVDCPADTAAERSVLLLHMLTGEAPPA